MGGQNRKKYGELLTVVVDLRRAARKKCHARGKLVILQLRNPPTLLYNIAPCGGLLIISNGINHGLSDLQHVVSGPPNSAQDAIYPVSTAG